MDKATDDYQRGLSAALTDVDEAADYLTAALAAGAAEELGLALRDVLRARGTPPAGASPLARMAPQAHVSGADSRFLIALAAAVRPLGLRLVIVADDG